MSADLSYFALFLAGLTVLGLALAPWMARVFDGRVTLLAPVERALYRAAGVTGAGQRWTGYAAAVLAFNAAGFVLLYLILRLQGWLPFNPQGFGAMSADQAFNTAVSFMTNTNWQSYGGETALSDFSQMAGLTVQNFVSAATGIAVAVAVIRGLAARSAADLGNFWVDLTRATLYLLLPGAILVALLLLWQGVPQNLAASVTATTLEGAQQVIAQGPVASQEAIKLLGSNDGGFFNVNSAHPYENPTALSNLIECLSILAIVAEPNGAALSRVATFRGIDVVATDIAVAVEHARHQGKALAEVLPDLLLNLLSALLDLAKPPRSTVADVAETAV